MGRWRIALAAGLLAAGLPAITQAQVYAFVATPLTVTQGDVTDFTFTFTNEDTQQIGCTEVLFPDEFGISALGTPAASNGYAWSATRNGQWVLVNSTGGNGRLHSGESVIFRVTALATQAGAYIFDYHVHARRDCTGTNLLGTVTLPLTVLPAATPAPTPTAKPTATATPEPIETPTPSPKRTPDPQPRATPDRSTPSPTPTETPTPTPNATASPRGSVQAPSPTASAGPPAIQVAHLGGGSGGGGDGVTDDLGVGVDMLTLLDSPFEWIVPGAAVGVPGLLVVLFVGLQAVGALAWIPAVRRMGDDGDSRRRRRSRVRRSA